MPELSKDTIALLKGLQQQVSAIGVPQVSDQQVFGPPTNADVAKRLSETDYNYDSFLGKYVAGPIEQGLLDFGGVAQRGLNAVGSDALGNAETDRWALGAASNAIGQSAARTDSSSPIMATFQRGARGALRSTTSSLPAGIVAGPYGAIAMGGLTAGEQAYTEAVEAGYKNPLEHAIKQGGPEILIAGIFQKLGLGGAEKYFGSAGKEFVKQAAKATAGAVAARVGKDLLQELTEEELTTIVQQYMTSTTLDPDAADWTHPDGSMGYQVGPDGKQHLPPMLEAIADTAAQTIFQTAGMAGGRAAVEKTKEAVFGGTEEPIKDQSQFKPLNVEEPNVKQAHPLGSLPKLNNGKNPGEVVGYEDDKVIVRDARGREKVISSKLLTPELTKYEHTPEFAQSWAERNPRLAKQLVEASANKAHPSISDFENAKLDRRGVDSAQRAEFARWVSEVELPKFDDSDVVEWLNEQPTDEIYDVDTLPKKIANRYIEEYEDEKNLPTQTIEQRLKDKGFRDWFNRKVHGVRQKMNDVGRETGTTEKNIAAPSDNPAPLPNKSDKTTRYEEGDLVMIGNKEYGRVIASDGKFITVEGSFGQTTVRREKITSYDRRKAAQLPNDENGSENSEVPVEPTPQPNIPQADDQLGGPKAVTKKMLNRLQSIGYSPEQISAMSPAQAQRAIELGRRAVPRQPKQGIPDTVDFGAPADTTDFKPADVEQGVNVNGLDLATPDVKWTDRPLGDVQATLPMDRGEETPPTEETPPLVEFTEDGQPVEPKATPDSEEAEEKVPAAEKQNLEETPQVRLAKNLQVRLHLGDKLEANEFWAMADEAFGGTRSEGKYGESEAYDALELALNLIADSDPTVNDVEAAKTEAAKLREIIKKVPSQTTRTGDKIKFQQFSTPPDYAYAVAWIANIQPTDIVLEPSAGTGSIARQAANAEPAAVYGNEITDERVRLLAEIADETFQEDARQIGAILYDKMPAPTVVLMNPPFSHDGKNLEGKKIPGIDREHIDQALQLLADNGRLVAIVGAPMMEGQGNTRAFQDWMNEVGKTFNVRANIRMGRNVYKGYGTTFPTQVLVIDRTGPTDPAVAPTLIGKAETVADLIDLMKGIRDERLSKPTDGSEQKPVQSGGAQGAPQSGGGSVGGTTVQPPTGDLGGTQQPGPGKQPGVSDAGPTNVSGTDSGDRRPGTSTGVPNVDDRESSGSGTGVGGGDRSGDSTESRPGVGQGELPGSDGPGTTTSGSVEPKKLSADEIAALLKKRREESAAANKPKEPATTPSTAPPQDFGTSQPPTAATPKTEPKLGPDGKPLSKEMQDQLDKVRKLMEGRGGKLPKSDFGGTNDSAFAAEGVDPEMLEAVEALTGMAIADLGMNNFTPYVRFLAEQFGDDGVKQLGPYVEQSWDYLRSVMPQLGPVGSVAAIIGNTDVAPPPAPPQAPPAKTPKTPTSSGSGGGAQTKKPGTPKTDTTQDTGPKHTGTKETVEGENKEREKVTELSKSIYEDYKPSRLKVPGAKPHKGALAESAAMAAVEAPEVTYKVSLPKELIENGDLSEAQLEQIYYAGQSHSLMLPAAKGAVEYRQGYAIGDGTGVGKGREIAGIILDNFNKGRKKAVWITKNHDLKKDAERDWTGLGQKKSLIFDPPDATKSIAKEHGILFTTYDTLKSGSRKAGPKAKTRLEQMIEWIGEDFDGVIAFDESHLMAGAVDSQNGRGTQSASQTALAGLKLQEKLPKARIVYISATMATEVRNLGYAPRLGMWGHGAAFTDVSDFIAKIAAGGVAAMEMIARDLKAMGRYLARTLSFNDGTEKGTVKYRKLEHKFTEPQKAQYDKVAEAWQLCLENINAALNLTNASGRARANAIGQFRGSQLRFFDQFLMTLQMPSVIESIEKDIAAGDAVILQLTKTEDAAQERALGKREEGDEDFEDFAISPMDELLQMVERAFPVNRYQDTIGPNGTIVKTLVTDSKGNPVVDPRAVAMRDKLLGEIRSIGTVVSESPIDMILNHFGVDNVAEITGRKRRVVKTTNERGEEVRALVNRTGEDSVKADANLFMDDKKRILIFSEKGGTGSSYHADLTKANQRMRRHYLLQAGWKASAAVQGFGRSHRTNQAQAPEFILVSTDLAGHKRFISTIARRLAQLGALTKGQRETGFGGGKDAMFSESDNLEGTDAADSLRIFFNMMNAGKLSISIGEFEAATAIELRDADGKMLSQMPKISQVLNRMLMMPVDAQNRVFGEFLDLHTERMQKAKAEGQLDTGIENIEAERIDKLQDVVVRTDEKSGAKTRYVKLKLHVKNEPNHWETNQVGGDYGAKKYVTYKDRIYAVYERKSTRTDKVTGKVHETYKLVSPQGGTPKILDADIVDTHEAFHEVSPKNAELQWKAEIESAPKTTQHTTHMIVGLLLPIWDKLPAGHTRVMRGLTSDGEALLGRIIPAPELEKTLKNLGVDVEGKDSKPKLTPEQAVTAVLDDNMILKLDNGWMIRRALFGRENRIELKGPAYGSDGPVLSVGVFKANQQSKDRYFIPVGDKAAEVMKGVTDLHKIVGQSKGKSESNDFGGMDSPMRSSGPVEFGGSVDDGRGGYRLRAEEGEGFGMAAKPAARTKSPQAAPGVRSSVQLAPGGPQIPVRMDSSKQAGPPQSAAEIISTMSKLFGVPMRKGRVQMRRALAIYKRLRAAGPNVIRFTTQADGDIAVAAHEVAHHLDKMTMVRRGKGVLSSAMRRELKELDYDYVGGKLPFEKARDWEGFAEFMRHYWTDEATAKAKAPQFYDYFVDYWLTRPENKQWASAIDRTKQMVERWQEQGAKKRGESTISDTGIQTGPKLSFWERTPEGIRNAFNRFYTRWKDSSHVVNLFDRAVEQHGYKWKPTESRAKAMIDAYMQKGPAAAARAIEDGVFRVSDGKKLSAGLREVLADIQPEEYNDFRLFAYARHAQEVHRKGRLRSDGKRVPVNPGISFKDANWIVGEVMGDKDKAQRYIEAADGVTKFNNALLDMLVDSGVITSTSAEAMKAKWETYVPLFRARPKGSVVFGGTSGALVDLPKPIKARVGSGLQIMDPVESTIQQAAMFYDRAYKQQIMLQLVREGIPKSEGIPGLNGADGMGEWIERVPPETKTIGVNLAEVWPAVVKRLEQLGIEDMGVDIDDLRDMGDLMLGDWTNIYRTDYSPDGKHHIFQLVINDQPYLFQAHKDLYSALKNMDAFKVPAFLSIFSKINKLRRLGATGLNTLFSGANVVRDWVTFQFQTRHSRGPESLVSPFIEAFNYIRNGAAEFGMPLLGKEDEATRLWKELGGQLATKLGLDRDSLAKARKDLVSHNTRSKLREAAKSPLDTMRDLVSISDVGPRLAEFVGVLRKHGYRRKGGKLINVKTGKSERPPNHVLIEAINAANDVTVNFGRMGTYGKGVNEFWLFFNAGLESIDKMTRTVLAAASGDKQALGRLTIAVASTMATAALYWAMRSDDDDYEEQEEWLKNSALTFTVDGQPVGKVPLPYEWGFIFNATRATLDSMKAGDASALRSAIYHQALKMVPGGGFQGASGVAGAAEVFANYDMFRERPIESPGMQNVDPRHRYQPYTSGLMKAIGDFTNLSPVKLEHLANSYTGGLYNRMTQLGDAAASLVDDEEGNKFTYRQVPFAGGFYVPKDYTKAQNDFYAKLNEAKQRYTTAQKFEGGADDETSIAYHTLYDYSELLGEIHDAMPPTSDRDRRFKIDRYAVGLSRHALGQEELDRYPNPLTVDPEVLPMELRKTITDYQRRMMRRLSEKPPSMQLGESFEAFQEKMRAYRLLRARTMRELERISTASTK